MANDLINHVYAMCLHRNAKGWGSESYHVGEPEHFHMLSCWAPNSVGTEAPLSWTLPPVSLHLAVQLYPLICFVMNWPCSEWAGFLSSVSCSSKLIKPEEGSVGTSNFYPVSRSTDNNLNLQLTSEGGVVL